MPLWRIPSAEERWGMELGRDVVRSCKVIRSHAGSQMTKEYV